MEEIDLHGQDIHPGLQIRMVLGVARKFLDALLLEVVEVVDIRVKKFGLFLDGLHSVFAADQLSVERLGVDLKGPHPVPEVAELGLEVSYGIGIGVVHCRIGILLDC